MENTDKQGNNDKYKNKDQREGGKERYNMPSETRIRFREQYQMWNSVLPTDTSRKKWEMITNTYKGVIHIGGEDGRWRPSTKMIGKVNRRHRYTSNRTMYRGVENRNSPRDLMMEKNSSETVGIGINTNPAIRQTKMNQW